MATTDQKDRQLAATFREGMQMWSAMRAEGASKASCVDFMAKCLREAWPEKVPWQEWPEQYRQPRCPHCDGYGLIVRESLNRLKCEVREGTPCKCYAGDKFHPRAAASQDFTAAGKTPEKKGFTRWSDR